MLYLVSFHLLDLRFVITKAIGDAPRAYWLQPQWLWAKRNRQVVGRLGKGLPIPGRDRLLPAFKQHASVDGGLMLQTADESAHKRVIERAEIDGFIIHNREIMADEWGQVRFDLLAEATDHSRTVDQNIAALLALKFIAPLDDDTEVTLAEAGPLIARVYEAESLKTCSGYENTSLRSEAVEATAGTVFVAAESPQVTLIDLDNELSDDNKPVCDCNAPCTGMLTILSFKDPPAIALCWHLRVTGGPPRGATLINAAWSAAFGLSWLVGHLHELAVFDSRVEEYELGGRKVLKDNVRSAIKYRNALFGTPRFGGWVTSDILSLATHILWVARGEAQRRLEAIQGFADDRRDAAGITGNIIRIINLAGSITMSQTSNVLSGTFTGSNVNVASTLTNVTQTIGNIPNASDADKDELKKLVAELHAQMQKLSTEKPDRKDDIDALAFSTDEMVRKAAQEKPNRPLLERALDSVKVFAKALEDAAPQILSTATSIASIVAKILAL